jgi:hypothetical protein
LAGYLVNEIVELLVPETRAFNTSAAKQQLLYINGDGDRDPLFDIFRQSLRDLGNGGYPNQEILKI